MEQAINRAVSHNIRRLREQRKLTLDGAAELTGVSRSMLAQIEKGDANPTISVLWKIANGYKVSFTSLLEDGRTPPTLLRRGQTAPIAEDEGRYWNYPAFPFDDRTLFESYRIEILPQGHLRAEPHLAGAEEFITVFAGTAEITVGEERFVLADGDSLRFRADQPHSYRNPGTEPALLSMVIYYGRG